MTCSITLDVFVGNILIQQHMQCNLFAFLRDVTPHNGAICNLLASKMVPLPWLPESEISAQELFGGQNLGPAIGVIFQKRPKDP